MLRAQSLTDVQQADFVVGALEGCARREVLLVSAERRNTAALVWALLEDIFDQPVPLAVARSRFFQCHQGSEEALGEYQLRLREVHARWRAREPGDAGLDDAMLRDQFLLGLRRGPVKQELQRQVRCQPALTFLEVGREARGLELEQRGDEGAAYSVSRPSSSRFPEVPEPAGGVERWKDEVRAELRRELQDQMASLGKTLNAEIQQQLSQAPFPRVVGEVAPRGQDLGGTGLGRRSGRQRAGYSVCRLCPDGFCGRGCEGAGEGGDHCS